MWRCLLTVPSGVNRPFGRLSPCDRQVAYALLTRPPLAGKVLPLPAAARLACVRPAASVYPEPGSNSSLYKIVLFPTSRGTMYVSYALCLLSIIIFKYRRRIISAKVDFPIRNNTAKVRTFSLSLQIFRVNFSLRNFGCPNLRCRLSMCVSAVLRVQR